jgi:hypothetical protein
MHSWVTARGRRAALFAGSFGFVFFATASAAEPLVIVKYQSAFADYHHFDAQAPTLAWRQANDAIGSGSEGASHGMHGMHGPTEPPPADTTESQPTTSGDHREHRQ